MLHIAVIGSGPAGYYTAEAAQQLWGDQVRVDIFDRMPVPFGLIRSGVAPDHQGIKSVARHYEALAMTDNVRFVGGVSIGGDVTVAELQDLYDAVVLATGAPTDRPLDLPGADLGNVFGSADFVGWYNGHPQFAGLAPDLSGARAVVIGNGNVALDVARMLAKTREEFAGSDIASHALNALTTSALTGVTVLGRRGPHQITMSAKELGELSRLSRAAPHVDSADLPPAGADAALDTGLRKAVQMLRGFAEPRAAGQGAGDFDVNFDFYAAPRALLGQGRVEAVEVERTQLVDGCPVGTGEIYTIPASLVISCIGYQTVPIAGVPYDVAGGRFANSEGRVAPGLYCVGWARRGPSGTVGSNRPDGFAITERIAQDLASGVIHPGTRAGRSGFEALAQARGIDFVTFRDWQAIDQAEVARARSGAPREKFTDLAEMRVAAGKIGAAEKI